jgi:deoxyribose-phosphate aldolase
MVRQAKALVGGSKVKVASVATAFPSGQTHIQDPLAEVRAPSPTAPTRSTW